MPDQPTTDDNTGGQPELLTITEAADLLRAPVATLRYWRHLGTGPAASASAAASSTAATTSTPGSTAIVMRTDQEWLERPLPGPRRPTP